MILSGLLLVGACTMMFGIDTAITYHRYAVASDFFEKALKGTDVELAYKGAHIRVADGDVVIPTSARERFEILSLAYARLAAERQPYFALAGTDPVSLSTKTAELLKTRDILAALQDSPKEAAAVRDMLYPLAFLRMLGELEDARTAFIHYGSDADGARYARALDATIATYRADLEKFRTGFEKVVPLSAKQYGTAQYTVSRDAVITTIGGLVRANHDIASYVHARQACIDGTIAYCTADDIALPHIATTTPEREDRSALALAKQIERLMRAAGVPYGDIGSALIQLSTTTCPALLPGTGRFFLLTAARDGTASPIGDVRYAGDLRFVDTDIEQDVPFYAYFQSRNIRHVLANMTNYYTCIRADSDRALVLGVRDVRSFSRTSPLSAGLTGADKSQARALERALASDVVRESDARSYVALGLALAEHGGVPQSIQSDLITLALGIENRSVGLDSFLGSIVDVENTNARLAESGLGADNTAPFLFYVRSAFMGLFLASNPSATGSFVPDFATTSDPGAGPYRWYSQRSLRTADNVQLIRDIRFYYTLHLMDP